LKVEGRNELIQQSQIHKTNKERQLKVIAKWGALVSLPDGAWNIIDTLKPQLGGGDSEIVRNIVLAYFIDKGYLLKSKGKKRLAMSKSHPN
jgi:hypothetical protein